jgi:hypothetical protein
MTSEIDKLKHFHVENYSDTNLNIKIIFLPIDILINVIYYHIKLIKDGLLVLQ